MIKFEVAQLLLDIGYLSVSLVASKWFSIRQRSIYIEEGKTVLVVVLPVVNTTVHISIAAKKPIV
jgi:translation initiation factor 2 alpha subunit (eIF-2alpha)